MRGDNVLDADYDASQIASALRTALFDEAFRQRARNGVNPYWQGGAGERVAEILATVPIDQHLLRKQMVLSGGGARRLVPLNRRLYSSLHGDLTTIKCLKSYFLDNPKRIPLCRKMLAERRYAETFRDMPAASNFVEADWAESITG